MQMKKPSFCWTFSTDNPLESDDSSGLSLAKKLVHGSSMSLVSVIFRTKEERKAGDRLLLRQLERGLSIAAQGRESRSAVRASTAAGSVAQLAQKRHVGTLLRRDHRLRVASVGEGFHFFQPLLCRQLRVRHPIAMPGGSLIAKGEPGVVMGQPGQTYFSSSRSRCARVRTGNCWLVRESKWRGRPRRRQASRMRRACSTP